MERIDACGERRVVQDVSRPSKEDVRKWLDDRRQRRQPLPEIAEIQRQLDWTCRLENNDVRERG
ncbi:hypothetical protein AYR66_15045 [Noviherbaspirillum denitrificans]|uniref:Uncharacterized protein n=1 Tax=Noviherbaspirillum denitrificans TaxID=1968433 RepID=A0A254TEM3_9BURK|nr:hypothetical protein AYR66_15045 [Noviherbaspirillum denitrificans]